MIQSFNCKLQNSLEAFQKLFSDTHLTLHTKSIRQVKAGT